MLFAVGLGCFKSVVHLTIIATDPETIIYVTGKGTVVKWKENNQLWISRLGLKSQLSHQKAK